MKKEEYKDLFIGCISNFRRRVATPACKSHYWSVSHRPDFFIKRKFGMHPYSSDFNISFTFIAAYTKSAGAKTGIL